MSTFLVDSAGLPYSWRGAAELAASDVERFKREKIYLKNRIPFERDRFSVKQSYAHFCVSRHWTHFLTVTFRQQCGMSFEKACRLWNKCFRLAGCRGKHYHWLRCTEYHLSGALHFHALLRFPPVYDGQGDLFSKVNHLAEILNRLCGHSWVSLIFDSDGAAAAYVAKYVSKSGQGADLGIDLSAELRKEFFNNKCT